jgi:hypothetical protein
VDKQAGEKADGVDAMNTEPDAVSTPQESARSEDESSFGTNDTALSVEKVFVNKKSLKRRLNDTLEDDEDEEYDGGLADGQSELGSAARKTAHPAKPNLPDQFREIAESFSHPRGGSKRSSIKAKQTEVGSTRSSTKSPAADSSIVWASASVPAR